MGDDFFPAAVRVEDVPLPGFEQLDDFLTLCGYNPAMPVVGRGSDEFPEVNSLQPLDGVSLLGGEESAYVEVEVLNMSSEVIETISVPRPGSDAPIVLETARIAKNLDPVVLLERLPLQRYAGVPVSRDIPEAVSDLPEGGPSSMKKKKRRCLMDCYDEAFRARRTLLRASGIIRAFLKRSKTCHAGWFLDTCGAGCGAFVGLFECKEASSLEIFRPRWERFCNSKIQPLLQSDRP